MHEIIQYAIYDKKAEIYDTPLYFLKDVQAERWFFTLVQQKEGRFQHFKDDMELHKISKFNVNNGKVYDVKIEVILEGKNVTYQQKGENNQ